MKTVVVVALFAALPAAAQAPQWNWTEHAYPEDGFRAEFNAPVTIRPMRLNGEGSDQVVRGTQYMLSEGRHVYVVAASLSKGGVNFDKGVRESFAGLECGIVLSDEPVDAPWGSGRELRARHCVDGTYRAEARYHRSGRWFYQVLALYKDKGGDEASARYFLESFRVMR
jgi:hypothetical protein